MSADKRRKPEDVHDALNRMKRAADRGTGCYLTPAMIDALVISVIGEMWSEPDPRTESASAKTTEG